MFIQNLSITNSSYIITDVILFLTLKDYSLLSISSLTKTRDSPQKIIQVDLELDLHEKNSQISTDTLSEDIKIPIDRSSGYITRQTQTTLTYYHFEQNSSSLPCNCGDSCTHHCKKAFMDSEVRIPQSLVSNAIQIKTTTSPSSGEYSSSLSCSCGDSCPSDCQKAYDCCDRESCDSEIVEGIRYNNETKHSLESLQARASTSLSPEINQKKGMERKEHNQISENPLLIEQHRPKFLPLSSTRIGSLRTPRRDVLHIADKDAISLRSQCAFSIQITRANSTGSLFEGSLSKTDPRYTSKDLSAYLGMKDQISKSILQHEVCIFRYPKQTF